MMELKPCLFLKVDGKRHLNSCGYCTAPLFTDKNDVIRSTEPTNIQDDVVFLVEILGRSEI